MVQPYFSSARCNPSDRLNRHGRSGCNYVERQKPGNDFDKVTERRSTTRRIKKELPIVSVSDARARKFISETQHSDTRSTRFSVSVQKLMSVRVRFAHYGGCKEQRSGVAADGCSRFAYLREAHRARTPRRPLLFT